MPERRINVNKLCFNLLSPAVHGKIQLFCTRKREKEETMICKNCGELLEEDQFICPACGADNTPECEPAEEILSEEICPEEMNPEETPEEDTKPKWSKKKITKLVLAIVAGVLAVSLLSGIAVLALRKNDVYYKGKYETSDFWSGLARNQVVATVGDYKLTNSQLQVFYWMQVYDLLNYYMEQYGDYAVYYLGLDLDTPLSEQVYDAETGKTWEQYFLESALFSWHRYQALTDAANKAGYRMPEEYQKYFDEMESSMEESAQEGEFESVDAMLQADLGTGVTFDDYRYYMELYYIGNLYFTELTQTLTVTDEELEAFFTENKESLAQYGVTKDSGDLVDIRNILIKPVGVKDEDGNTVYPEEAWNTCHEKAVKILTTWQAGEMTEEAFAELAKGYSEDKSNASGGGLYQHIAKNDLATVDVRHILIKPQGGKKDEDGTTVYSDEEWEACRTSAQEILDLYLAGAHTEAAFGALANEHSDDNNGNVTNGGLYTDVPTGKMVQAFEDWIFDSSRTPGETGLVKTPYGYHVMYFVSRNGPMDDWIFADGRQAGDTGIVKTDDGYQIIFYVTAEAGWRVWCRDGVMNEKSQDLMDAYAQERPMEVQYWKISLSQKPEA